MGSSTWIEIADNGAEKAREQNPAAMIDPKWASTFIRRIIKQAGELK